MPYGHFLLFLSVAFALSWGATIGVRRFLLARGVMDTPNDRSSHDVPVPRGGGLAVLGVIFLGLAAGVVARPESLFSPSMLLIPALCLLFLVSWWDDRFGVKPPVRLLVHVVAAVMAQFAFPFEMTLFDGVVPVAAERILVVLGWAWFMNLYNFMDGIDGITSVETISVALSVGALLLCFNRLDPAALELVAILVGACAGFLVLNWHKAKIFLGDVGSVPLGFLVGFLLLKLAFQGHLLIALIPPLYYLADSGVTILRRLWRKEKIWLPHRTHFYQVAAAGIGRHDRVVLWIVLANMTLFLAALVAILHPVVGFCLACLVVVALLWAMHRARLKV